MEQTPRWGCLAACAFARRLFSAGHSYLGGRYGLVHRKIILCVKGGMEGGREGDRKEVGVFDFDIFGAIIYQCPYTILI